MEIGCVVLGAAAQAQEARVRKAVHADAASLASPEHALRVFSTKTRTRAQSLPDWYVHSIDFELYRIGVDGFMTRR
ncbi:hypothetical protein JYU34_007592 [Plutella xylostella]|uniref:Uncharacterized protein n=1 Tax=Plutella xylostella TaxID=51655 RepID=A0ABQ7QQS7_PLUXY|nr:hypothetical protein JYU34_007592 [Plutella xylostella]